MRIYESVDCEATRQSFGSLWLVVLRGTEEAINSVFNGVYNWGGCNGELDWHNQERNIATFWTTPQRLVWCFAHMSVMRLADSNIGKGKKYGAWPLACEEANLKLESLAQCQETFLTFDTAEASHVYTLGSISAERPDEDWRDAIVFNAFKDRSERKSVDLEAITDENG